ncbi:MAG: hypothetical protein Ct9H300mP13_5670 [Gammaproteobacteria bacterium]|nr:MAG: hypothetical protein Ct9H300mP13_5670 [Gammaproteobacteria bacterium]
MAASVPGPQQKKFNVTPDIMTVSKTLGGVPLAGVVTSDESRKQRTAGGSILHFPCSGSVPAAVGLAVIDVIERRICASVR